MADCSNPLILQLHPCEDGISAPAQHLVELTREATVGELLEALGTDCLEIRFQDA